MPRSYTKAAAPRCTATTGTAALLYAGRPARLQARRAHPEDPCGSPLSL